MEIKKIVEGMTADQVAEVIDDNFHSIVEDTSDKFSDLREKASKIELQSETNRSLKAEQALDLKINEESERAKEVEEEQRDDFEANKFGFNVTVYGEHGGVHNLLSAIKDIPKKYRMLGQKITFRTENGDWATYHNESLSLANYEKTKDWVQEVGVKEVTGDVNIENSPDYEDLTEAGNGTIKFADKEYSKSSFSGLGRIYLRKNVVNGVNILSQDMMLKENTRYIIQYDYDLKNEEVEVPVGCVLVFDGGSLSNGSIRFNGTLLLGAINIDSTCNPVGSIRNRSLNVDWFGAKNDGQTDNAEVFRNVINLAYNSTNYEKDDYGKVAPIIKFGYGKYVVNSTLIDENSDLKYGVFKFQGEGLVSSVIHYKGDDDTYLFYNKSIFAYTSFEGLRFVGTDRNNFMYLYSDYSTNIAQSLFFRECRFGQFKTIMKSEGNTMCSEVYFDACKIVYFPNEDSELFIFNNLQAVNWRFFGTEIEQTYGTVFKILQGTYISIYSSSIIPIKGLFIDVPSEADTTTFWDTNTPALALYSCRFEMRDDSRLLRVNSRAYLQFIFNTCSMGGRLIGDNTESYTIDISSPNGINQVTLIFNNCSNLAKYKYRVTANQSSFAGWVKTYFNNCIVYLDDLFAKSELPTLYNSEGCPKFYVDGVCKAYETKAAIRRGEESFNYLLKSSADSFFAYNIPVEGQLTYDSSSAFKKYSYIGALAFNIVPTQDIRILIYNTAQTVIYGDFHIKAGMDFREAVRIGKYISASDGIIMSVANKGTQVCNIEGHLEVMNTYINSGQLLAADMLTKLNAVSNGFIAYNTKTKMPVTWDGEYECWRDSNSMRTIASHKGITGNRPTPNIEDIGFFYFDTTLNKAIWWNGSIWVDANGNQM